MHVPFFGYLLVLTFHKREKANIVNEINLTSASKLHSCLNETALFKELVAQFLAHDGYVESAKAFAEEVRSEENALKNGPVATLGNFSVEDNLDAVNRQRTNLTISNHRFID